MNLLYIFISSNNYLLNYREESEPSISFDYLDEEPITFYNLYKVETELEDCTYNSDEYTNKFTLYSYNLYEYHNTCEIDCVYFFNYNFYSININFFFFYTNTFNLFKVIYFNLFKHTSLSNFEFFFLIKQNNSNILLPSFFYFYQNLFFQKLVKLPVQIKNFNSINFLSKDYLAVIMFQLKKIKWWKYEVKYSTQLIELILITLQFKNLNLIMRWIKSYFERRKLKKHKKLFFFLKYLFLNLIWKFSIKFNIKGVRLYLKGKVGKSGSVRKSKKFGQKGKVSYTTKSLALVSEHIVIRTTTGTMGFLLEMFFY